MEGGRQWKYVSNQVRCLSIEPMEVVEKCRIWVRTPMVDMRRLFHVMCSEWLAAAAVFANDRTLFNALNKKKFEMKSRYRAMESKILQMKNRLWLPRSPLDTPFSYINYTKLYFVTAYIIYHISY